MRRSLFSIVTCALLAALAAGQGLFGPSGRSYIDQPTSGLFSQDRISMRQSFSASYLSSGKSGVFTNLYQNTIGYRLSDKLQLQLGLGYRFTPGSAGGSTPAGRFSTGSGKGLFLPSFSMRYQPSDAVMFQFQYQTVDPYAPLWWGR
jgi:hypothetical protein